METTKLGSDVIAHSDGQSVTFEKIETPKPAGQAFVMPERAKTTRDLEMEAGARRVAAAKERNKNLPPRVIPDAERRAESINTSVFRPNSAYADRATRHDGSPVSQHLGSLMRKVGGQKAVGAVAGG
jgi:hypothetical protein